MRTIEEQNYVTGQAFVIGFLFGFGLCGSALSVILALMFHSWVSFLSGQVFVVPILLALWMGRQR